MRTKIVYVVVSSDKDFYLDEAFISMYSARFHNPDAKIILVIDDKTEKTLTGKRKNETKYADEIISVPLNNSLSGKMRSRILKTTLRDYIEGDMVFIDSDTIIAKPLDQLDTLEADLAAVYDQHSQRYGDCLTNDFGTLRLNHLGWPISKDAPYFNGGFLFSKDNDVSRNFYKLWNENLLYCFSKNIFVDQPSFYWTNHSLGYIIKPLDGTWNCQGPLGLVYFREAKVIHYLGRKDIKEGFKPLFLLMDKKVIREVNETGEISQQIKDVVKDPIIGLAPSIVSVAGEDLAYLKTNIHNYFRSHYGKWQFNLPNSYLKLYSTAKSKVARLIKKKEFGY